MLEQNVTILYNTSHEIPLGLNIAIYFFLTGVSAGSFIVSTLAYVFGIEKYKNVGKLAAVIAPLVLIIAPLFLIIDLLQPLRFIHLFYMFNVKSPVTWGTFLLIAYPVNCLIYLYHIYFTKNMKAVRLFGSIGIPLAVCVHGYTGFILALAKGIALWNTPLMPIYFLISAMVSGIALLIFLAVIKDSIFKKNQLLHNIFPKVEPEAIIELGKLMTIFLAIDLFIALSEILVLFTSGFEDYATALVLTKGSFKFLFIWVEIIIGSILPLILLILPNTRRSISAITLASILILIGVMAMRYVTVVGGQYVPLT